MRPIAGAFVAVVASSHALPLTVIPAATGRTASGAIIAALSAIPISNIGLLVILVIGAALALLSHSAKLTTRFVSTLTTAGLLNWIVSLGEDVLVLIIILLSLFASAIMLVLLLVLALILVPRLLRPGNPWMRNRGLF